MNVMPIPWKSKLAVAKLVRFARQTWPATVVLVLAVGVSVGLWQNYLPHSRQLWTDVVHDRNAHLEAGLGLTSDLIHGRIGDVIRDVDRFRTWPPLHDGVLVGTSLIVCGMDIRSAVLPSLVGFAFTAIFAFMLTRMLLNDVSPLAGLFAATLVLVSPAQRGFATDVMLESLGACLTLAALVAAVRVNQGDSPANWRWLAIALSGLFFLKYNYWFLVVVALVLSQARTAIPMAIVFIRQRLHGQIRNPLNWIIVLLVVTCLWVKWSGGGQFKIFGKSVVVHSTMGLATAAYWLLLVRLAPLCWTFLRASTNHDPRFRMILNWHLLPVAIWLAWPQKLACFLWVLNPSDNVGEFPANDRLGGFAFYVSAIAADYHFWVYSAVVVGLLISVGIAAAIRRQLQPGAGMVATFVLLAAVLTAAHPNRKSRFLHSWLPAAWVLAATGAGMIGRRQLSIADSNNDQNSLSSNAVNMIAALNVALVGLHVPALFATPHAPEGGIQSSRPSALTITDSYLPLLAEAQKPAIFSNVPMKFLARWTYLDRYGRGNRAITEIPGFDATRVCSDNNVAVQQWISKTDCDSIVLIQIPPDSHWFVPVPGCAGLEQLQNALNEQCTKLNHVSIQQVDGATIQYWRKQN